MNSNFLLLTDEAWIKIDRMIVNLKSLKGDSKMRGAGMKIGIVGNTRDIGRKCGMPNSDPIYQFWSIAVGSDDQKTDMHERR